MRFRSKRTLVFGAATASVLSALVGCQQEASRSAPASVASSAAPQVMASQELSVTGENYCLGCLPFAAERTVEVAEVKPL